MTQYTSGRDDQSVDEKTRRRFLQLSGLAGVVGLAGCGSDGSESAEGGGSGGGGDGNGGGDGTDESSDGDAGDDEGDGSATSAPAFAEDTFVLLTGSDWDEINTNYFNGPFSHNLRKIFFIHGAEKRMSSEGWVNLLWNDWSASLDPNYFEIELKDTTFWQAEGNQTDGKQITAEDWKFTQEMYRFQSGNELYDDGVEEIEIVDEKTLRLHSANQRTGAVMSREFANWNEIAPKAEPYLSFYERFQDASTESERKSINEELLDLNIPIEESAGTGAWKIDDVAQTRIKTVANEGYFGRNEPGGLDFPTFEVRSIPEDNLAKQAVMNGEMDGGSVPNPTENLEENLPGDVSSHEIVDPGGHGLVFNHGDDLFSDPDLHVAFSHMMDYAKFPQPVPFKYGNVEGSYFSGMGPRYAGQYLSDEVKETLVDYYEVDHDRAAQHLRKAGFELDSGTWYEPNGDEFTVEVESSPGRVVLARGVAQFLNDFGIDAETRASDEAYSNIGDGSARVGIWDWAETGSTHPALDYSVYYTGWMAESYNGLMGTEVIDVPPVGEPTGTREKYPVVEKTQEAFGMELGNPEFQSLVEELAWAYNTTLPALPLTVTKSQHFLDTENFQMVGNYSLDGNLTDTLEGPEMLGMYTGAIGGVRE
jgi:ABC-type transport system substrate-binding protein